MTRAERQVVRQREGEMTKRELLNRLMLIPAIFFLVFIGIVLALCAKRDILLIVDLFFLGVMP